MNQISKLHIADLTNNLQPTVLDNYQQKLIIGGEGETPESIVASERDKYNYLMSTLPNAIGDFQSDVDISPDGESYSVSTSYSVSSQTISPTSTEA